MRSLNNMQPSVATRSYHAQHRPHPQPTSGNNSGSSSNKSNAFEYANEAPMIMTGTSSPHRTQLFPRSYPTPVKQSEQLLCYKAGREQQQHQQYAQSWTPNANKDYDSDQRQHENAVAKGQQARLVSPSPVRSSFVERRPYPGGSGTNNNNGAATSAATHRQISLSSPPARGRAACRSEPGTPSSQERVQALLKQRHAHVMFKSQQQATARISHSNSANTSNQEEKKDTDDDDDKILPFKGPAAAVAAHSTTRLQTLLHKRRQQASSYSNKPTPALVQSSSRPAIPKVAQHLEDFEEIMNSTTTTTNPNDDTFSTDPDVFGAATEPQQSFALEFQRPLRNADMPDTAASAPKSMPDPKCMQAKQIPSKSIQAAHLAHRHGRTEELETRRNVDPFEYTADDIVQPPALQRRHYQSQSSARVVGNADDDTKTKSSPLSKQASLSLTTASVTTDSSPSPRSSRVQAIKQRLWDEQSERLKPQTDAWKQQSKMSTTIETSHRTKQPMEKPVVSEKNVPERSQEQFHKSRFAQTYNLPTAHSGPAITTRKELKPPAAVEATRGDVSKLDQKLSRHARSLSPLANRSTTSLRSGVTTVSTSTNPFSSRFIDAAIRMTPDRIVGQHSKSTSAMRNPSLSAVALAASRDASYSDLVMQLRTVSRDDPSEALAQIDAILARQESLHTLSQGKKHPQEGYHPLQQAPSQDADSVSEEPDDSSDDGTSVSSITNPIYGHHSGATYNDMAARSSNAGGTPRPSGLQAYSNFQSQKAKNEFHEALHSSGKVAKSENKRKKRPGIPPPDQIETKSSTRSSNLKRNVPLNEATISSETRLDAAPSGGIHFNPVSACATDSAATSVLDRVENACLSHIVVGQEAGMGPDASNSQNVAEKISRWDQLTGTLSRALSFDAPNVGARDNMNDEMASKRTHPWDFSTLRSRVDLRETSMDAGAGLEARIISPQMSTSIYSSALPSRLLRVSHGKSQLLYGDDLPSLGGDEEMSSRRRDVLTKGDTRASPVAAEKLIVKDLSYDFDMLANSLSPEKKAWVAVPSSPFFSEAPVNSSKRQQIDEATRTSINITSKHNYGSMVVDDKHDGTYASSFVDNLLLSTNPFDDEETQAEVLLSKDNLANNASTNPFDQLSENECSEAITRRPSKTSASLPAATQSAENLVAVDWRNIDHNTASGLRSKNLARMANDNEQSSIEVTLAPSPLKGALVRRTKGLAPPQHDKTDDLVDDRPRRTGIKSFLKRRDSGNDRHTSMTMSYCVSSSHRSSSVSERPFRSKSIERNYGNESLITAADEQGTSRGRRRRSKSPARGRSYSLDERRIRNPSIARKFSRLLRVYEYDNDPLYDELQRLDVL